MTPERWREIERLYHAAAERAPDDRAPFLARACGADEDLRRQVTELLAETLADEGFADGPVLPAAAGLLARDDSARLTGQAVGGYVLQELLGRGGMGEVYRAQDPKLGRDVAIKILPTEFTSDPQRIARFEREARMLAAVNHPNICAIYGIEASGPFRYLILEIVEGRTLGEILSDHTGAERMPLHRALAIARQISAALEVAHEKGIIHRDLKPANIKITPDGVVKVLDFGLAKPTVSTASGDLTDGPVVINDKRGKGPIIGTAAYMSPEQARGLAVDKRSDIWAFGCVLYEMLAGRQPFSGDTVSDTIAKILEREPVWSALPASTPAAVRRLLIRCLAKNPKDRLRDIGDARIEIDAVGEAMPGVQETVTRPRPRWPAALAVAVMVLAAVAALAGWLTREPGFSSIADRLAKAEYTPVTDWEATELDAAITADGKFVAFVADASGAFQIWMTQLGTGKFNNLTPDQQDERNRLNRPVGFSVDGLTIWFSGSPAGRRLRTMPFTGGALSPFLEERAIDAAWSADNMRLVYLRADENEGDPLFVGERTGGNARQILAGTQGEHNHFPTWSVDGRWIYYVHFVDEARSADLWRVPAVGGAPERLTEQYTDVRYPTPIDIRTVLYVARDESGGGPWIWALDVETKARARVSVGPTRYLSVAASGNGRRLIATTAKSTASLWSVPILERVADEQDVKRYAPSRVRAFAPRFGSESLFYLSSSGSGDGLWRGQGESRVEVWKASDGVLSDPVAIAPSGRIAVTLRSAGKAHLVLVSSDGAVRKSIAAGIDVRGTASWSPDGNWIVTAGWDAAGPGLFKISAGDGAATRLATGQALDPVWSPNGDLIVYAGPLSKGTAPLLAVRPDGRAVSLPPIRTSAQGGGCVRFLPSGAGLVYSLGPVGKQALWLLDLSTNQPRQIARLPYDATMSSFDVTPDGQHIIFDRLRELADIVLIDLPQ